PLRIAAKLNYQIGEKLGRFFHRNVAAIADHDHLRMEYFVAKLVSIMDRNDLILIAPNDKRRLIDQMSIGFDAFGVPISRRRQNGMMRVRGVQRPSDVFDTPRCYQIEIFGRERRPHTAPYECGRIDEKRREDLSDDRDRRKPKYRLRQRLVVTR